MKNQRIGAGDQPREGPDTQTVKSFNGRFAENHRRPAAANVDCHVDACYLPLKPTAWRRVTLPEALGHQVIEFRAMTEVFNG